MAPEGLRGPLCMPLSPREVDQGAERDQVARNVDVSAGGSRPVPSGRVSATSGVRRQGRDPEHLPKPVCLGALRGLGSGAGQGCHWKLLETWAYTGRAEADQRDRLAFNSVLTGALSSCSPMTRQHPPSSAPAQLCPAPTTAPGAQEVWAPGEQS